MKCVLLIHSNRLRVDYLQLSRKNVQKSQKSLSLVIDTVQPNIFGAVCAFCG